jgi:hypothetical protein
MDGSDFLAPGSVLEPDLNLPNDDIVTIWLDSLSVDFPNGGSPCILVAELRST